MLGLGFKSFASLSRTEGWEGRGLSVKLSQGYKVSESQGAPWQSGRPRALVSEGLLSWVTQGHLSPPPPYRNQEPDIQPGALCTFGDRHFPVSFFKMQTPQRWAEGTGWQRALPGSSLRGKGGVVVKEIHNFTCFSAWLWPQPWYVS